MRGLALAASAVVLALFVFAGPASAAPRAGVAALQVTLRDRGLYHGTIDGIRGELTARALRRFQRRAGLTPDGILGPHTRRSLGCFARHRFGSRLLHRGMRGWDVAVLQFLLRRRGAAMPVIDARFGPWTRVAVVRFQIRRRLVADGVVGRETRRALLRRGARRAHPVSRAGVRRLIRRWASHYGVNPRLALALAWIESGFQPQVRSPAGAWGVMQVTPATWGFVESILIGRDIPKTTSGNVRVGVAYLHFLIHDFGGRVRRALWAYTQGPWSVRASGPYHEARRFAANVLAVQRRI
jgi:hypothetical protein